MSESLHVGQDENMAIYPINYCVIPILVRKSSGNSTLHVEHLMEAYLKSYGRAVDDSQGEIPHLIVVTGRERGPVECTSWSK